jgi:tRNA G18 (ribose-2'-O)-methylase SpoU
MPKKLLITELNRLSAQAFKSSEKLPLVVVLDDIRSLHNVGSVFRTCDAFRIEKIILCGKTGIPPHPEIHKSALGAEYTMEWLYMDSALSVVHQLKKDGYVVYAIEQAHDSISLENLSVTPEQKYAIVVGNEVKGVQQSVVDACDACIEIPQFGTKHSLNVSVAGGIVIWHFFGLLNESSNL